MDSKEGVERHTMDLAAKAALMKTSDGPRTGAAPQPQSQHLRLGAGVARTQALGLSVSSQTTVSTYSQTMLKQVNVSARGSNTLPLSPAVVRPPLVPQTVVSSASHVSTIYHVPRGAAAVANIAAPRSAVATPMVRAATASLQTPGVGVCVTPSAGLRGHGAAPLLPRSSSPAPSTSWLASSPPVAVPAYCQGRPAVTSVRSVTCQSGGRMQQEVSRGAAPGLVHSVTQKSLATSSVSTAPVAQLSFAEKMFKSTVSVAQVVPQGAPPSPRPPARPATAARITVGTCARLGVPATGRPRLSLVTTQPTAQARFTVAASPVVSLQPVVMPGVGAHKPATSSKVMAQPSHAAAIQITQVPVCSGKMVQSLQQTTVTRTIAYAGAPAPAPVPAPATSAAAVPSSMVAGIRPITVANSPAIPVAKVFPTAVGVGRPSSLEMGPSCVSEMSLPVHAVQSQPQPQQQQQQQQQQQPQATTSVYIQTSHRASPAPSVQTVSSTGSSYTLPATYFYETASGYQVARPFQPSQPPHATHAPQASQQAVATTAAAPQPPASQPPAPQPTPRLPAPPQVMSGAVVTQGAPSVKFSPVMVVESSRTPLPVHHPSFISEGVLAVAEAAPLPVPLPVPLPAPGPTQQTNPPSPVCKLNASPRPSILRKRDNDGSPLKAQKNLAPVLAALSAVAPVSPPSPRRPDSRGNGGNSSGGSTTISATSSPGLNEVGEDSLPAPVKSEPVDELERPPVEMSPRKKPRKQQLTRNELTSSKFSEDEMEFLPDEKTKDIKEAVHGQPPVDRDRDFEEKVFVSKRPHISLINSYRHTWKSRHNHFLRYTDVKAKEERRPTVADLAAQKHVLQKLNGWKIYHLSTQMEELAELESHVVDKLSAILKVMERKTQTDKEVEKDVNRLNELIKGNMQRSKIIKDQMQEAEVQVKKIVEHKDHVSDIISKCGNKRCVKKREKM